MHAAGGCQVRRCLSAALLCVAAGLGVHLLPLPSGFALALGLCLLIDPGLLAPGLRLDTPRVPGTTSLVCAEGVLEALDTPVLVVDADGCVVLGNEAAARLLEQDAGDLRGAELGALLPEADRERALDAVREVVAAGRSASIAELGKGRVGGTLHAVPIRGPAGGPVTGCVLRFERGAGPDQGLRDEFFSSITHELRAPLTSIRSFAEILQATSPEDGDVWQEFLDIIRLESERMTRLVNELLDLSRLESGMMSLEVAPLCLGEQVQLVRRLFEPLLHQKRLSLEIGMPAALPRVLADRDRVHQVLVNLVGNAVKFSPVGSVILLEVGVGDALLEVSVDDEGPGIPEAERTRIFSRYHQVRGEGYAGREAKGTGLGLSICKLLVEAMGGGIRYEDSRLLAGSSFRFTLPVVPAPASSPA
ncbi:MAG: ATP-binding protein [Planctomycetota bacterium]